MKDGFDAKIVTLDEFDISEFNLNLENALNRIEEFKKEYILTSNEAFQLAQAWGSEVIEKFKPITDAMIYATEAFIESVETLIPEINDYMYEINFLQIALNQERYVDRFKSKLWYLRKPIRDALPKGRLMDLRRRPRPYKTHIY